MCDTKFNDLIDDSFENLSNIHVVDKTPNVQGSEVWENFEDMLRLD